MRPNGYLFSFIAIFLFTLACFASEFSQPILTTTPTEMWIITSPPTLIAVITPVQNKPTATPIPLWVKDFADPINSAVANRKPDFQDDFSLNRSWINVVSGEAWPHYAEIHDGLLFQKLPEKTEFSILYHPKLNRRNFLLTLELWFDHNQPNDIVRFQFDQIFDQSISFDLSNNRNWNFHWDSHENKQSVGGIYEHFPPEHVSVTIMMRGSECAVYLNNDPLAYSSNCRTNPMVQSKPWIASFRLLRDTGRAVAVNFDNLKLWDLDNISGLP